MQINSLLLPSAAEKGRICWNLNAERDSAFMAESYGASRSLQVMESPGVSFEWNYEVTDLKFICEI